MLGVLPGSFGDPEHAAARLSQYSMATEIMSNDPLADRLLAQQQEFIAQLKRMLEAYFEHGQRPQPKRVPDHSCAGPSDSACDTATPQPPSSSKSWLKPSARDTPSAILTYISEGAASGDVAAAAQRDHRDENMPFRDQSGNRFKQLISDSSMVLKQMVGRQDLASSSQIIEVHRWSRKMEGDGLDESSTYKLVAWSRSVLANRYVEQFIAFTIVLNAGFIAAQADRAVQSPHVPFPTYFIVFDVFFTVIFTAEICMRLLGEGKHFVSPNNRHLTWNLLDSLLVTAAIGDEICKIWGTSVVNMSFVRLVRFLRFVRIMRIIRVMRFLSDLRNMVSGIMVSLKPLLWAIVLLMIIALMFAIFILEFVSTYLELAEAVTQADEALLKMHFGTLATTTFSLYKAIMGGISWGEQAKPLINISPLLGIAFSMYVAFAVLCVMNIVTGIFVENAGKLSMKDEETLVLESLETSSRWEADIRSIFEDLGGSDRITSDLFFRGVRDFRIQAKLKRLGADFDPHALMGLFDVLDWDKTGELSVEEFALGMKMLHGNAKSIDILRLVMDNISIKKMLKALRNDMTQGFH